jgi:N-acetylglutamate synthase-like GNAT family acetyltransferase
MIIRRATGSDISALHSLIESAYRGESSTQGWTHESYLLGGQRIDQGALRDIIESPTSQMLIAENGDGLCGCVQIADAGHGLGYLGLLAVSPSLQTGGIGKLLIAAAETKLAEAYEAKRIEMTVINLRTELIDYYKRRGYTETGEMRPFPYDDVRFGIPQASNLDFIVLEKLL